ncbi:MAG: hypothetical protein ACOVKL_05385 [Polynucleobacter sp.]
MVGSLLGAAYLHAAWNLSWSRLPYTGSFIFRMNQSSNINHL